MTYGAFPVVRWNGRGLGVLGDDTSTLMDLGFNSLQIQQIISAHQSGALSDIGYQDLVNGGVSPDGLADFMAADPGAPTTTVPKPSGTTVAISNVNATLTPRPSPTVAAPSVDPFAWFSQSTVFAGIPNWSFVLLGIALVATAGGGYAVGRRR